MYPGCSEFSNEPVAPESLSIFSPFSLARVYPTNWGCIGDVTMVLQTETPGKVTVPASWSQAVQFPEDNVVNALQGAAHKKVLSLQL
jgi:hypothetical protein